MSNRCLVCLRPSDRDYHPRCLRRLTGSPKLAALEVDPSELHLLGLEMSGKVTLSGVQRKIAIDLDGATFRVAVAGSRFLLKPQITEYPEIPENEHLTLQLADLFGIPAAQSGLVRLRDDSLALLVRRFDRTDEGEKIAMEDFCQLAELLPGDKYRGSAELCARLLKRFSAAAPLDLLALFRQLLFSWWTGNGDVHLKNLALLSRIRGEPRLSPGYDLVNTAVVIPGDPFALPMDGKQRNLGPASWLRFAEYCELPVKAIRQVARALLAQEAKALAMIDRSYLTPPRREQYVAVMNSRRDAVAAI